MPDITFIQSDGIERTINCVPGQSLMQAARANDIAGILAECGGACTCATCHVILLDDWAERVNGKSEDEDMILDGALAVTPASRLSCQIEITDELDGLRLLVPDEQM